jgi:hypothetical protein
MPSDAQVLYQITKGLLYLHKVQCSVLTWEFDASNNSNRFLTAGADDDQIIRVWVEQIKQLFL